TDRPHRTRSLNHGAPARWSDAAPTGHRSAQSRTNPQASPGHGDMMRSPAEPDLVIHTRRVLRGGAGHTAAVGQIVELAAGDRAGLADAVLYQVRTMHRLASDDFDATSTLRVLETALRA